MKPQQHFNPAQPLVPGGTTVYRDLPYVTGGHERRKLDLYLPRRAEQMPLIIWVHGSASMMGSKDDDVPLDYLAQGYAVASINYRLSQHAIFPAQIEDCKAAVRWLRANAEKFNLDPERFGAWGASAGGHLVAMLGTAGNVTAFDVGENPSVPSHVQAVVDYFGPTDFLQMDEHRLPDGQVHNLPDSPESLLVGGSIQEMKDRVAEANPITYVTKNAAPFLIVHGENDPLVPHHQSALLESALKRAGVPVSFYTVKGGGHGGFTDPKVPELTKAFFATYLKPAHVMNKTTSPEPETPSPETIAEMLTQWIDPITTEPPGTRYCLYPTPVRGANTQGSYLIYLPPGYERDISRRFPVIYWLHGGLGNARQGEWAVQNYDAAYLLNNWWAG